MNGLLANLRDMIFLSEPLGFMINMVIMGLFGLGCLDVFRALKGLTQERRLIEQARRRLEESPGACPKAPVADVLVFLGVPEKSLLGRRVARVMRLRASGLSQRDVLQQLSVERIEGYGALARYIGVTLTLLGLLGTVFGMSLALFKIQNALAGVDSIEGLKALVGALGDTLQGMKTAFGCTLSGLLTAILLSYLNYLVRGRQSALIQTLEEFVVCDLLPVLQKIDPDADSAARSFAQLVIDAAEELNTARGAITAAASEFQNAGGLLVSAADSMNKTGQSFGQNISQVVGNQQAFTAALNEMQQALKTMTDVVARQYTDGRAFTTSTYELLDRRQATIEESAQANRVLHENLQKLIEHFGQSMLGYHEQFRTAVDGVFASFKTSLGQSLSEVNGQYRESIVSQLKSNQQALEAVLAQHQTNLQQLAEQNSTGMAELFGTQRTALHDFADMLVDVRLNLGSFAEGHDDGNGYARAAMEEAGG
jgi:hypothetical protein